MTDTASTTLVGLAALQQTANDAEVGHCGLCGQELIRTERDCWHPWNVPVACPPEPAGQAEQLAWLNAGNRSLRPGREHWLPGPPAPTPEQVRMSNRAFLPVVEELVTRIDYRPDTYRIEVDVDRADPDGRVFIQVLHTRPDAMTGRIGQGKGGKRYLSPVMTEGELVRAIFAACLAYEEHEVREFFRYSPSRTERPLAVFGPHIDVVALYGVADALDVRP